MPRKTGGRKKAEKTWASLRPLFVAGLKHARHDSHGPRILVLGMRGVMLQTVRLLRTGTVTAALLPESEGAESLTASPASALYFIFSLRTCAHPVLLWKFPHFALKPKAKRRVFPPSLNNSITSRRKKNQKTTEYNSIFWVFLGSPRIRSCFSAL